MSRKFNFSAGPAVLPEPVLEQVRAELMDYAGSGASVIEQSHRGKPYGPVHDEAIANLRELMAIPEHYSVLFLQGGASTQFAMVPMNLLGPDDVADYTDSGAWGGKAIKEARGIGRVNVVAACGKEIPTRVPREDELALTPGAAYLHITTNETISGAQWKTLPRSEAPLVADMSSDILSRPLPVESFGLIYAGLQKNLGPAGAALVILRTDLAERVPASVPTMFRYATHIAENSLFNTPPCFCIYVVMLVTRWLKQQGLQNLFDQNIAKAAALYAAIDATGFYRGTALPEYRSDMNVTWRLPTEALEAAFVKEAAEAGFIGLKGHRSVGGIRASIYNAMPPEGVTALIDFMRAFEARHG